MSSDRSTRRSRPAFARGTRRSLITLAFILAFAGCVEHSGPLHLKLAHSLSATHPVHKAMVYMGERLAEYSGGTMTLEVYAGGQLGSERELIELLQIGSIDMAKVSASPLEGFVPEMKIFNVPYLFRDAEHYHAVLDSPIGRELLLAPEPVRLRGLGYYDAGSRSFYAVGKPIETPDDLRGLKIRVQESQTALQMVKSFGAAPTPIAWGELYTALQQGVVDAAENNPPSYYLSGHYEVAKYFTLDEHTSVPDILLIGRYAWDRLDTQQREWLQRAVDDSIEYQRRLWREETATALEAVEAAGVRVIHPDKAAFAKRVEGVYARYEGTEVGELIRRIRAYRAR
ncbi:MAG TPA: TRAP transporter substrate-binding protein [Woeseiaceae bacterium]|nr:TRAP transporter substrate-binding protein [Woeseiaceae bacterium]